MNLKIFSIIVGILIAVIVILGGTYYYLFEYSKPKNYTLNTNTYTEKNRIPITTIIPIHLRSKPTIVHQI